MALDDALAAGQAAQRDRLTGQVSLFDTGADATVLERPLPPNISEAPPRERLRWEKELLGLYLSDHPLGELAGVIGEYVTAYSGEMGEELDQQRICVGGVVTEVRKVITKARATMGVATLEDLQGTIEVIVFPKVYEQTEPTWAEDAILLVAGRVDHKGEETVLLADAVWTWEEAQAMGSAEFTRQLGRMDRGRRPRPVGGYVERQRQWQWRLLERQRPQRQQQRRWLSRARGASGGRHGADDPDRVATARRRSQRQSRGAHRRRAAHGRGRATHVSRGR